MSRRRWTDADDDLLIALRKQANPHLTWETIGARFGVSGQAAFNRCKKLADLRQLPSMQGHSTSWSRDEDVALLRRCDAGEPFETLGRDLGRSHSACKQRYNILKRRAVRPVAISAAVRADPARDAAIAEATRLRRDPPVHHNITAWFCGDPLPGRSALDQLQGGRKPAGRITLAARPAE